MQTVKLFTLRVETGIHFEGVLERDLDFSINHMYSG